MPQPHRVSGKFEFSNRGTLYSFDPKRTVYDNLNGGKKTTLLELHLEIVRLLNQKDIFVIDAHGNIVNPDGSFVPYHTPKVKGSDKPTTRRKR